MEVLSDSSLYILEQAFIFVLHETFYKRIWLIELELEFFSKNQQSHSQEQNNKANAHGLPRDIIHTCCSLNQTARQLMHKEEADEEWGQEDSIDDAHKGFEAESFVLRLGLLQIVVWCLVAGCPLNAKEVVGEVEALFGEDKGDHGSHDS